MRLLVLIRSNALDIERKERQKEREKKRRQTEEEEEEKEKEEEEGEEGRKQQRETSMAWSESERMFREIIRDPSSFEIVSRIRF